MLRMSVAHRTTTRLVKYQRGAASTSPRAPSRRGAQQRITVPVSGSGAPVRHPSDLVCLGRRILRVRSGSGSPFRPWSL